MGKSLFSYLSLSVLVCVFFVYATDVDTGTLDIIVVDSDTTQIALPVPADDPIGTVGYDAHTWKLLFTTSLDANHPDILGQITGAGEYIMIRTKDATWCTDLTLNECRRNSDFIDEIRISIAEPTPVIPSDVWVETTLEILPTGEIVITSIDAFPGASVGEDIDTIDVPVSDIGEIVEISQTETWEVLSQPLENIQENQEVIVVPVKTFETETWEELSQPLENIQENQEVIVVPVDTSETSVSPEDSSPSLENAQKIEDIDNHIEDITAPVLENIDPTEHAMSEDSVISDNTSLDWASLTEDVVPTDSPVSDV